MTDPTKIWSARASSVGYITLRGKHGTGRRATVDADVAVRAREYSWSLNQNGYVEMRETQYGPLVRLHQFVTGRFDGVHDHINHNRLDNRRANLRVGTHADNARNPGRRKGRKLPIGVAYHIKGGYQVYITRNYKRIGRYSKTLRGAITKRRELLVRYG